MSTSNRYDKVARVITVRRIYLQNGPWYLDPRQMRAKPGRRGKRSRAAAVIGDANREHALQRRAPSALAAGQGDRDGNAKPQA